MCLSQDTRGILTHNCSDTGFNSYRGHIRRHQWMSKADEPETCDHLQSAQTRPHNPAAVAVFPLIAVSPSDSICNADFLIEVQKISWGRPDHWRMAPQSFLTGSLAGCRPSVQLSVGNKMTLWPQPVFQEYSLMKFTETTNKLRLDWQVCSQSRSRIHVSLALSLSSL